MALLWCGLKLTLFRATPCRAYAIMRSKDESLSAGEMARHVGQYQDIRDLYALLVRAVVYP